MLQGILIKKYIILALKFSALKQQDMLRNLVKYSMHFLLRAWYWHTATPFLQSHTLKLTKVMIVAANWFTIIICYICIVLCKFINIFIYLHRNVCEGCSILILQLMQLRTNEIEIYSRSFINYVAVSALDFTSDDFPVFCFL